MVIAVYNQRLNILRAGRLSLFKKLGAVILMAAGLTASGQTLPPPQLHLPQPAPGATATLPGSTANVAQQAPTGNYPAVKLSARIDPLRIYSGEFFNYLVELTWEKTKSTCEVEFKLPEVPKAENVKATGSEFESENAVKAETEQVKRVYKFNYYPEKAGKATLAQADFEYRCRGTEAYVKVSAPPFPVEVQPKRFQFADLKGNKNFQIAMAAVLLAAILSTVVLFLRGRKYKKAEQKPVEIVQTAEDRALDMLKSADQYRIAGRYPDYFLGLERVLRTFLEEKYSLRWSARERLVEEIASATMPDLGAGIDHFLILSDRVKFAGQEPSSSELDSAYQAVRRIIDYKKLEIAGGGK